jgi:tetratricopeptide (TPR) repeat protein/O-antigen ligase
MKVSYWLYLFILIFAPLAFGTVELWSLATVEVLTGVAAILLLISVCFFRKEFYCIPGVVPLLLMLVFILLQLIPLPVNLVQFLSPASYSAYAPVLSMSGGEWISLTINQKATLQEFFRISCHCLFYILTIQLLSINGRLKKTVHTVIGLAVGIALMAIVQQLGSPEKFYWFQAVSEDGWPFRLWINSNQFAGFMEMMVPLTFGLFLYYKPRVHLDESLREKIVNFFTMPGSNLYLFIGGASTLVALSVFVSLCQGSILTIAISAIVFVLLYNTKRKKHGRAWILVIIAFVVMAFYWFGWDTLLAEFNHGTALSSELSAGRQDFWEDSLRIIHSFFLFGSGFGTYIDIFPSFVGFSGNHTAGHVHNNFLEFLTDGGVIGFVLASWFLFSVLRHGWRMIRIRRDQYAVLLGIGSFTGIIAMLTHSLSDFNMHNGADYLYLFFFCGLLVAVVNTRFEYCESTTLLKKQSNKQNISFLAGTMVLTAFVLVVQYGALRARAEYGRTQDINVSQQLDERRLQEIKRGVAMAKRFDPIEYLYDFKLGTLEWFLDNRERSLGHFLQAARKNPMNGTSLQRIGLLVDDEAMAMTLFENGYQRDPNNYELTVKFVEYLLQKREREKAVEVMAERLQKTPILSNNWALLRDLSFSRAEIAAALPHSVDAWINYGLYLEKENKLDEAEHYFNSALTFLEDEEQIKPEWFQKIIQSYRNNGQPEQAILILRQAVEVVPDYAPFHVQFGDYCRKEGITFLARQEYQRALMLDPGNKEAQERLRQMELSD